MKILVYDVAAESGGALTILNSVYQHAILDSDNQWVFITSIVNLDERENIITEKYPKVKISWVKRLLFDKIDAKKILKRHSPDIILNLQNVALNSKIKQVLYMHQSLPFIDHKFSIKEKKMWVYQNIIGRMIKRSCERCYKVIVQTHWIAEAIIKQTKTSPDKIQIIPPQINCIDKLRQNEGKYNNTFFFPAGESIYKNHEVVVKACKLLDAKNIGYKVVFSLTGDETEHLVNLRSISQGSSIEWRGQMKIDDVFDMYSKSILLFPSYIETFGLPLLEARVSNAPVLAADTAFSREVLDGYDKASFFVYNDSQQLAEIMEALCCK